MEFYLIRHGQSANNARRDAPEPAIKPNPNSTLQHQGEII